MMTRYFAAAFAACALLAAGGCASQAEVPAAAATTAAAPKAPASPAVIEKGRSIYKMNCAACHGETGKGDGPGAGVLKPPPRDHTDAEYMSTLTDEDMAKVIQMGGAIKGRPLMPSSPQIKGDDLDAVVAFIRSLSAPK
ncbi:MAG TPA: cytochrome c [Vicinamibacterales bacterium]|nr:cytochrome c [Vicinamibacterales bacterium]